MFRYLLLVGIFSLAACESEKNQPIILPELHIQADTILWKEPQPARIAIIDQNDEQILAAKVHYRGGSSSKYHKHSYALKLDEPFSLANLPAAKSFILNASYIDKTLIRHALSFQLYRDMHQQNISPMCSFAELYENEDYKGLYVIMQRINAGLLNIKKNEGAALWKEPLLFYTTPPEEFDQENKHSQKYPSLKELNYTSYVDSLGEWITQSNDSDFQNKACLVFDCDNIIDWHLLLLLSNNSDGQLKNFYLYRVHKDSALRVAIWDYDHSFGRDGDGELNMLSSIIDEKRNPLLRRLSELNVDGFNDKTQMRYAELRRNQTFSEKHIYQRIEELQAQVEPYMTKNTERWPHDADWYFDDMTFSQEVQLIKDYLKLRLPMLDERFGFSDKN
jgi:spore coat protein CotH